eukprot:4047180-Prymnesium_polylepis.1
MSGRPADEQMTEEKSRHPSNSKRAGLLSDRANSAEEMKPSWDANGATTHKPDPESKKAKAKRLTAKAANATRAELVRQKEVLRSGTRHDRAVLSQQVRILLIIGTVVATHCPLPTAHFPKSSLLALDLQWLYLVEDTFLNALSFASMFLSLIAMMKCFIRLFGGASDPQQHLVGQYVWWTVSCPIPRHGEG